MKSVVILYEAGLDCRTLSSRMFCKTRCAPSPWEYLQYALTSAYAWHLILEWYSRDNINIIIYAKYIAICEHYFMPLHIFYCHSTIYFTLQSSHASAKTWKSGANRNLLTRICSKDFITNMLYHALSHEQSLLKFVPISISRYYKSLRISPHIYSLDYRETLS